MHQATMDHETPPLAARCTNRNYASQMMRRRNPRGNFKTTSTLLIIYAVLSCFIIELASCLNSSCHKCSRNKRLHPTNQSHEHDIKKQQQQQQHQVVTRRHMKQSQQSETSKSFDVALQRNSRGSKSRRHLNDRDLERSHQEQHLPNILSSAEMEQRDYNQNDHLEARDITHFSTDHSKAGSSSSRGRLLPNGPPPFRPSTLVLGLNRLGALEKLKRTKIFKRIYKSKVYYLFLDVVEQLTHLVDQVAKKKIDLAESNMLAVQAMAHKLLMKGGQQLKLKWPLVMLNPHFIKEVLSSPTMLVMLFHTIEVAYMSMPMSFWLKPLVKLVKQPAPEKEEEVWWHRKRFYDVLNGPGSSELQPNLKAAHFRHPGEPAPINLSGFAQMFRQLTGHAAPNPAHFTYPPNYSLKQTPQPPSLDNLMENNGQMYPMDATWNEQDEHILANHLQHHQMEQHRQQQQQQRPVDFGQMHDLQEHQSHTYMSKTQEQAFLANQAAHQQERPFDPIDQVAGPLHNSNGIEGPQVDAQWASLGSASQDSASKFEAADANLASHLPEFQHHSALTPDLFSGRDLRHWSPAPQASSDHHSAGQLMSQSDFESLDARERELVLQETRRSILEARLADNLIKQQSEFVDSIRHRHQGEDADGLLTLPSTTTDLMYSASPSDHKSTITVRDDFRQAAHNEYSTIQQQQQQHQHQHQQRQQPQRIKRPRRHDHKRAQ